MIQLYSNNLDVAAQTAIPLNNVSIRKGCTAVNIGPTSIALNERGVYMVTMDAFAEAGAAGTISIQLRKDGVLQPDAISSVTGAVGEIDTLHFQKTVQVQQSNTPCCCTSPTILEFINAPATDDVAVTGLHINVIVTKLC
jgi:hypothetical protein